MPAAKDEQSDDRRYLPSGPACEVPYRLVPERAPASTVTDVDGSPRRWAG